MTGAADEARVFEWDGGTLDELMGLLAEAALTVRVEAVRPGSGQNVGTIELVAGGVQGGAFGEERGDRAVTALKRIPGLRFRIRPALPDPDEGNLERSGPAEGSVADRPVTKLMRYCEDFVLTCALEISRGAEHARISYRRGEIIRTLVDGSEAPERLPDVIRWTDGHWRIVLPQLNLPRPRKAAPAAATPAPPSGTLFGFPAPVIPGVTTAAAGGPAGAAAPPSAAASPAATAPPAEIAPHAAVDQHTAIAPAPTRASPLASGPAPAAPLASTPAPGPAPAAAAATAPPADSRPTPASHAVVAGPPLSDSHPTPERMPVVADPPLSDSHPTPERMPVVAGPPPSESVRDLPTLPQELLVSLPPTPIDVPVVLPASLPPPPTPLLPTPHPVSPAGRVADDTRATPPPRTALPLPAPARARPVRRGFTDLPLVVHVFLGVVLGSAIVAGYWGYLSVQAGGFPGLR